MGLFAGTKWDLPARCERCGKVEADCACLPLAPPPPTYKPPEQQTARLALENRARGKQVTAIRGLASADNDLPALLTRLKSTCGAGGTISGDELELQGKHLDRVRDLLAEIGYKTKG